MGQKIEKKNSRQPLPFFEFSVDFFVKVLTVWMVWGELKDAFTISCCPLNSYITPELNLKSLIVRAHAWALFVVLIFFLAIFFIIIYLFCRFIFSSSAIYFRVNIAPTKEKLRFFSKISRLLGPKEASRPFYVVKQKWQESGCEEFRLFFNIR